MILKAVTGEELIVDPEDYPDLCRYRWRSYIQNKKEIFYASMSCDGRQVKMLLGRHIMKAAYMQTVYFKNVESRRDFRKSNLVLSEKRYFFSKIS